MKHCSECEFFKSKHQLSDYNCTKDGRCFLDPPTMSTDRGEVTWERPEVNNTEGCGWHEPRGIDLTDAAFDTPPEI